MTSTTLRPSTGRSGTGERGLWRRSLGRMAAALALVASVGVAVGGSTADPAEAQAPPVTGVSCAPGEGVTVVVDFNGLPGGIRVGCARGPQANGFAALAAAGFAAATGEAPGIVCTIDGVPVEGYPYCWLTGGFWSYWRTTRGGSWAFSPVGATGGPLPVDSVEGWSWAPGFASQAPRANENSVPPVSTSSTTSTSSTSTSTSTTPPMTTTSTTPSTTGANLPTDPATTPTTGAGAAGSDTSSTTAPAGPAVAGGTLARTGSDTRAPVTVGLLLLAGGAVLVVTSRRLTVPRA